MVKPLILALVSAFVLPRLGRTATTTEQQERDKTMQARKDELMKAITECGVDNYVLEMRRFFHECPELRFQEEETLKNIRFQATISMKIAEESGIQASAEMKDGGYIVDFTFDPVFDRIIFRADVDALPISEQTGLPFASKTPGVFHACGHDAHIAMLLGAMRVIAEGKVQPKHNLRFVFQRAEENPISESGGAMLVREGVLDGIAKVYGLHIYTEAGAKAGQFQTRRGGFFANSGRVKIEVACTGGHVMSPESGSNASDILADLIVGLRHFAVTYFGPMEPVSFIPASVNAGLPDASNVRPGKATLWYAFRNLLGPEKMAAAKKAVEARIKAIVAVYPDAKVNVEFFDGHPALRNDVDETQRVMDLLGNSGEDVVEIPPIFGGEDFAHYLNHVPGNFTMLGAWQEGSGGHHTKVFNPDESVMVKGILYWLLLETN